MLKNKWLPVYPLALVIGLGFSQLSQADNPSNPPPSQNNTTTQDQDQGAVRGER